MSTNSNLASTIGPELPIEGLEDYIVTYNATTIRIAKGPYWVEVANRKEPLKPEHIAACKRQIEYCFQANAPQLRKSRS